MEPEPRKKLSEEAIKVLNQAYNEGAGNIKAVGDENGGQVFVGEEKVYPKEQASINDGDEEQL